MDLHRLAILLPAGAGAFTKQSHYKRMRVVLPFSTHSQHCMVTSELPLPLMFSSFSVLIRELGINELNNLVPDVWVVLDLVVRLVQCSGEPAVVVAAHVFAFVSQAIVAQYLCSLSIGRNNKRPSWRQTFPLIKIYCLCNVSRHNAIVLPRLMDAVYLDR